MAVTLMMLCGDTERKYTMKLVAGKAAHEAIRGGFGALLGFLFGVVLKLSVCALFTWWFAQACLTIAEG